MARIPDPQFCAWLLGQLRVGRGYGIKGRVLIERAQAAGFPAHLRRCGEAVAHLVQRGEPILSDSTFGYWLADFGDERSRREAKAEIGKRISSLARRLRALDAQRAEALNQLAFELTA